jgi:acetyl esterase/lipase
VNGGNVQLAHKSRIGWWATGLLAGLAFMAGSHRLGAAPAQDPAGTKPQPEIAIDDDGTYHLPAQAIPMSKLMTPEMRQNLIYDNRMRQNPKNTGRQPDGTSIIYKPYMERQQALYALDKTDTKIGGVHVYVYTPREGIPTRNKERVLIQLHASNCWVYCSELASQPFASVGQVKVVSIDYREPQFTAGMEDLTNVYSALIKTYKPQNVAIYGCFRGGAMAMRSVVWFERHNLPKPGAIGVLCSNLEGELGDAGYIGSELGTGKVLNLEEFRKQRELGDIDPNDPIYNPTDHPEIAAKFPPTIFISGTRSMELSRSAHAHIQLVMAGVDARLHVFEGGKHHFWYDPAPPESKQVYEIVTRFFEQHSTKNINLLQYIHRR